jgi:hypothetical protein
VTHKIFINGTAEGQPSSVAIWTLGKNFAVKQTEPVNVDGSSSYEVNQDTTESMHSGQYFVVVQRPMMNGKYNIDWSGAPSEFVYDYSGTTPVGLFKIYGHPTACGDPMQLKHLYGVSTSRTLSIPMPSSSSRL